MIFFHNKNKISSICSVERLSNNSDLFILFSRELNKHNKLKKYIKLPNTSIELFEIKESADLIIKSQNIKWIKNNHQMIENIHYCLYAIRLVHIIFLKIQELRSDSFDSFNEKHLLLLESFWNNMKPSKPKDISQLKSIPTNNQWWSMIMTSTYMNSDELNNNNIVLDQDPLTITTTRDWTQLGFQSKLEPNTDFRGMGLLGLFQLNYFSITRTESSQIILTESFNPQRRYFPFAVTGINITQLVIDLFLENRLYKLIYNKFEKVILSLKNNSEEEKIFDKCCNIIHELYCDIFEEFYMLWMVRNPQDIMSFSVIFNELKTTVREKYISIFNS